MYQLYAFLFQLHIIYPQYISKYLLREIYFNVYDLKTGQGNTIILDFEISTCCKEEIVVHSFHTGPLYLPSNRSSIFIGTQGEKKKYRKNLYQYEM